MRPSLTLLLALAVGGCASLPDSGGVRPPPLNVLFIIADDLSASALSCYGNAQCRTPNIDRLAARGVRFTRAYSQYPLCGPSRASLMSGLYPQAIGVTGNGGARRFAENLGSMPSLSGHFIDHGYYAARVSKIFHMRVPGDITAGVDGPDHAASWTERFNCPGPEWMTAGEHAMLSNEELSFESGKHYNLGFGTAFYEVRASPAAARQPDQLAADKAIELLAAPRSEPFFLAVGLVRPHVPLVAPASFYDPYPAESIELPPGLEGDWADIPQAGIAPYSSPARGLEEPSQKRRVRAAYYASVAFMDAQVGRLLDALDEQGLGDDTVVVFTSDHGYHLGEHDFWQKMSLHEESVRIPLVIAAPGARPAVAPGLVEAIDLYPTLADLAGLGVPAHCTGRSLAPILRSGARAVRTAAYSLCRGAHLLRTERFAYIQYPDGTAELYDMQADPLQFENLVHSPGHRSVVERLRGELRAKLEEIGEGPP